ncbi:MAG TPA: hypothetical protein VMB21_07335, partial [Candidatus Limnocylindria bacterium]|nr:hypothetical protein [Candidatus Limnocylindria bacterium]
MTPTRAEDARPAAAIPTETTAVDTGSTEPKKKPLPPVTPIALTNILSSAENGNWSKESAWNALPRGRSNDYAGVRFWLDGVLKLQGKTSQGEGRKFREKIVLPLPKATNFVTLHLLAGTYWYDAVGTKVAEVVWRYADGSFKRSPLQYNVHLRDWWGGRYEDPATVSDPHSKAAWHGSHPAVAKEGKHLRLYLTSLLNPDTNKPVKSLEFTSTMATPNVFIMGVTIDGLAPGARDGDFRDLDAGRGGLTGTQFITVLDSLTGKAIAGAKVKAHGKEHVDTPDFAQYDREGISAVNGIAAVQQSQDGLDELEIKVEAENYVTAKKEINLKKGDKLPPNLEIRLKGGLTLGGVVQDPDGQPLAGATVNLGRIYRGGFEEERKKADFDFDSR